MSPARTDRARGLSGFASLAAALVAGVLLAGPVGAGAVSDGLVAQPVFGAPAGRILGTAPEEAPGEAWALARGRPKIVRYTDAAGWETLPGPFGPGEEPIAGLQFAEGALAGRTTPAGGIAVAAQAGAGEQLVIVRNPGGNPHAAPDPGEALHTEEGESLFSEEGSTGVLLAPVEETAGLTGAFDVPTAESPADQEAVLDFDGAEWEREPICVGFAPGPGCTSPSLSFRVLAIDASGPENAWLLAKRAVPGEGLELFEREAGGGPGGEAVWRQRRLGSPGSLGSLFAQGAPEFPQPSPAPPLKVEVSARTAGQPLTVTSQGVWADAKLKAGGESSDATVFFDIAEGHLTGSWCDLTAAAGLCEYALESELPGGEGRSFAWASGESSSDPFGEREITGLDQGAMLSLEGTGFTRLALAGGDAGSSEGAALDEAGEGWLGARPPIHITRAPEPDRLAPWPVPFRRPLTAIAPQPSASVAALGSEALAVGAEGEVARYLSGQGWVPESLLTGSGVRAKPTLRAVAWPEPGRAFAVGDGAAMWVWVKEAGLWEPDPAAPPNLVRANFTGIAFDPGDPSRGYAVGKQGLLLAYGRQWAQEALPAGVDPEANFTSIAFAGDEAIATYKMPIDKSGTPVYTGGVLVNDGSGWRIDQGAAEALGGAVPERVAGLPDGGAAIVSEESLGSGESTVIERDGPGSPWREAPGGATGFPVALAAFREGGQVRAVISVSPNQLAEDLKTDLEQVFNQPPPGQPPLFTSPYPLPSSGYVIRQTSAGWRDEEHQAYPLPSQAEGQEIYDLPRRPDPVLALLLGPDGGQGWAVGGETGTAVRFQGSSIQTAGVMRYGPQAAPPANASSSPVQAEAGTASFAIGGGAQCAGPCADLVGTGIGPGVWLHAAVGKAAGIPGLHAFLYTGPGVAEGEGQLPSERLAAQLGPLGFGREEAAYARRLGSAAGALPTFVAPTASDLDREDSLDAFQSAFAGFGAPLGTAPEGAGVTPASPAGPGKGYYSFESGGSGGTVRVIVLDYSRPTLGTAQSCWLAGQLADAGEQGSPAIAIGGRDLGGQTENAAGDAAQVTRILVDGEPPVGLGCEKSGTTGASAYFFDFPEENRAYRLTAGGHSIPSFGNGTLGYLDPQHTQETDFVGASGFLLASVNVAQRDAATNVAPVGVRLIPDIGGLALDATDGTLLRRSHAALFNALARRPLAGMECGGNFAPNTCEAVRPDPYVPIPSRCSGTRCASAVFPEYAFTSSDPTVANFVAADPGSPNPRAVLLRNGKPILDSTSGLLCAFNPGTTTVTVTTGGLSYSTKVTVLGGSVQRPCGTTPLGGRKAQPVDVPAPLPPGAEFAPGPTPQPPPPAPVLPTPAPGPHPVVHHLPPPAPVFVAAPFVTPTPASPPVVPIVPPPPVPAAQPTPPSGTSPVSEREEDAAYDLVHHMVALRPPSPARATLGTGGTPSQGGSPLATLPAIALLAAIAAAGLRGSRPRRRPQLAYQATTARRHR
ncbi:MAG TPA: hypothetical protein VFJ64_04540 [Solirubrobacterales bacterium]|nr:hypothetical protein [Solirubrobacterales bacterium]